MFQNYVHLQTTYLAIMAVIVHLVVAGFILRIVHLILVIEV